MRGEESGFVIENGGCPTEDSGRTGANEAPREGIEDGGGFGSVAGGEKEKARVMGGEFADELRRFSRGDCAGFVFEEKARFGSESAVAGDLNGVGLFAGDAGGEEVEFAAFFDDEVEAEIFGGVEDGGFFGFVVRRFRNFVGPLKPSEEFLAEREEVKRGGEVAVAGDFLVADGEVGEGVGGEGAVLGKVGGGAAEFETVIGEGDGGGRGEGGS